MAPKNSTSLVNVCERFDNHCLIHQGLWPQVTPLSLTFREASCSPLQDVTEEAGLPDTNWLEKH